MGADPPDGDRAPGPRGGGTGRGFGPQPPRGEASRVDWNRVPRSGQPPGDPSATTTAGGRRGPLRPSTLVIAAGIVCLGLFAAEQGGSRRSGGSASTPIPRVVPAPLPAPPPASARRRPEPTPPATGGHRPPAAPVSVPRVAGLLPVPGSDYRAWLQAIHADQACGPCTLNVAQVGRSRDRRWGYLRASLNDTGSIDVFYLLHGPAWRVVGNYFAVTPPDGRCGPLITYPADIRHRLEADGWTCPRSTGAL